MEKYFCNFCDAQVDEKDTVCPSCGENLADENGGQLEEQFFCTSCSKPVKEEDLICPHCGANLVEMMDTDELVTLENFETEKEAKKASDLLKENGIASIVAASENGAAKLVTLKTDFEKAKQIIKK